MTSILLQGGTLLLHDENDHIVPTHADLLIEGARIARIAPSIPPPSPSSTKVINCASKIISPGFISTHAHLWQTQLKGQHPNHTLIEYMPSGCYVGAAAYHHRSSSSDIDDLFWGQLAGALESLDAGTTTVVDHAHLNVGPESPRTALHALATSGLRAVYCYCPETHVESLDPLQLHRRDPALDPTVLEDWRALAASKLLKQDGSRVSLGFAYDNVYLAPEQLRRVYAALRGEEDDQGGNGEGHGHQTQNKNHAPRAKLITVHSTGGPAHGGRPYAVAALDRAGVLGPDVLFSHAPGLEEQDIERLQATGAFVSSTPNTEMQMGMEPVSMWRSMLEGRGVGSLGVDCHSWGTSYMPTQMTLMLQQRRLMRMAELGRQGKWPRHVEGTVEEVFNLGTVAGARAVGMAGEIGRLREGFRADVVVFDGESPGMLAAAVEDPVAAVVLHSSIRDVDTVIVDGIVRKEGGRLCAVKVEEAPEGFRKSSVEVGRTISWDEVAQKTLKSRERVKARLEGLNYVPAEETTIDAWHMDRSTMVER